MNMRASAAAAARSRAQPGTGFLYVWLLFSLFIEYARPSNEFQFLEIPFLYSVVPLSLLLVTTFAAGLRPMKEIFSDSIAKWVPIFLGTVLLSWAVSGFSPYGSSTSQAVLGYAFLFILISRLVTTESRLRGVIITLTLAHFYLLAVNFNVLTNPAERQSLVGGTFLGDGNDFSLSLCILLAGMIEVALSARRRFGQLLGWSAVVVIILAIVATQSRGGTLGIAAVMSYLWWRSPRKLASGIAIMLVAAVIMLYAPTQYFQRMGTVTGMQIDGSAQGRLDAWSGAIGMGAKSPVAGIGVGQFGARWGKTAHSTYLLAFAELGLPGLVCILMLVFGNMRVNARLRGRLLARAGPTIDAGQRRAVRQLDLLNAAMLGFAVASAFLSAAYYPHMFVLTALLISARILATRASRPASALKA